MNSRASCGGASLGFLAALWLVSASQTSAAVYTLTLQTNGLGAVTRNPTNNGYPAGSVVTITAIPGNGWYFAQWSGDASGNVNPLNVTMSSNKVVTANFQPIPSFVLSTSKNGMGSIALDPPGNSYPSNSVVNATALPAAGWVFVNWSGDAAGTINPVAITMTQNKSVTANFAQSALIDVPPQNATVEVGATTNFSVHAVGTAPLFYQWWFNGSKLDNATSTILTLANIQPNQEGAYSISVSNAYGFSSNSALLTITNACSGTNIVSTASEAALRNAIEIGGIVRLCFNGVITLTNTILINHNVALDARNRSVTISGNDAVRLFSVSPGVTFSVTNVVLANGRHVGANGLDAGAQPPQSAFPGEGGAILNEGALVQLSGCALVSNVVTGGMGGARVFPYPTNGLAGEGRGGAISVRGGSLVLDSVTLSNNWAVGGPGVNNLGGFSLPDTAGNARGGAIYITNGSVLVVGSTLRSNLCLAPAGGNGAAALGGAVFLVSANATFTNSSMDSNIGLGEAAPVSTVGPMPKPSAAYGGALAALSGTSVVSRCDFSSNLARGGDAFRHSGTGEAQGGAVFSSATIWASESSWSSNSALSGSFSSVNTDGCGGGLYNTGSAVFDRCSFLSNLARGGAAGGFGAGPLNYPGGHGLGGGAWNGGQLKMTNCTMALNSSLGGTGANPNGVPGSGVGGGVYNIGTFLAVNATVATNAVAAGQGFNMSGFAGGANVANTNGSLSLYNSIIAYPGGSSNALGVISDLGFNISSDGSANFASGASFNFTDPLLGPPANYGGPTVTMPLPADSPAVDFGSSAGAPLIDQRGLSRPAGLGVDIGAYELHASSAQRPVLTLTGNQGVLDLAFQAEMNTLYVLQRSASLNSWTNVESIGPYPSGTNVHRSINTSSQATSFFRLFIP